MAGRMRTATMELAIGATIIAGVIILIVMLMAWGNSSSFLGRHYRVVVNMANVGGLKEGAPVKMGGFQIGRVSSIRIRPGGTDMELILDIDESRLLPRGSTAKIATAGLVGDAFMDIIPGKSSEPIRRAATVADAERLESSPLPDLSELLTKVNAFGDQLTVLTTNLNDIIGDDQFRRNIKSLAVNTDAVAYQANLILQRGRVVVDTAETAAQNISDLTLSLKNNVNQVSERVMAMTDDVKAITNQLREAAAETKKITEKASLALDSITQKTGSVLDNLDGGIADARKAINSTLGDPKVAADLAAAVKNIQEATGGIAARRQSIDQILGNIETVSGDFRGVASRMREILAAVEPSRVADTVNNLSSAITAASGAVTSMTEVVDKIKAEPVLALSVNKAADRIVKMKFDEMSRQPQFRSADATLDEINRWVRESMRRGHLVDPAFEYDNRPYTLDAPGTR